MITNPRPADQATQRQPEATSGNQRQHLERVIATFVQQFPEFKMVTTKKGGATYVELAA